MRRSFQAYRPAVIEIPTNSTLNPASHPRVWTRPIKLGSVPRMLAQEAKGSGNEYMGAGASHARTRGGTLLGLIKDEDSGTVVGWAYYGMPGEHQFRAKAILRDLPERPP
jgi:hypothetical protein